MNKYSRLYNTVKFLKRQQVYYRVYYVFRKKIRKIMGQKPLLSKNSDRYDLTLNESIHITNCYLQKNEFKFLNLTKKFENKIDWNYNGHGKLWTYNLTYFDFLSHVNKDDALYLLNSFIDDIEELQDGLEPFPISLRGINWIKYLSYNGIQNKKIDDSLYAQYYILLDNLEYHLLGNHLLENGFSLLFAAYYFQDEKLYEKSKEILMYELMEQILEDGAHFELSPMYHQIMLFRLLDCINLIENNSWKENGLLVFLKEKAELMLGWLTNISYENGEIPLLNDSANAIAPTTDQLLSYAEKLDINVKKAFLSKSGYRKFSNDNYECIVDLGHIGASYIPGHAHADTFNFELRMDKKPFIVDTGLSTYETNDRRTFERSTAAHNTVEVNASNQSEVWGGFRVGNRADIIEVKESETFVQATHDGYKKDKVYHTRKWSFDNSLIHIEDTLSEECKAVVRFHFHPSISKSEILKRLVFTEKSFTFSSYKYASEFNSLREALVLEIVIKKEFKVSIVVNKKEG